MFGCTPIRQWFECFARVDSDPCHLSLKFKKSVDFVSQFFYPRIRLCYKLVKKNVGILVFRIFELLVTWNSS